MQKNASFAHVFQSMGLKKAEPRAQLAPDGLIYFKIIKIKLNFFILYLDFFL